MYNQTKIQPTNSRLWRTRMGLDNAPTLAELQELEGEGFRPTNELPDPEKATFKTGKKSSMDTALNLELELPETWSYLNAKAEYYRHRGFHRTNEMPPPETLPGTIYLRKLTKKERREKLKWKKKIAARLASGSRI